MKKTGCAASSVIALDSHVICASSLALLFQQKGTQSEAPTAKTGYETLLPWLMLSQPFPTRGSMIVQHAMRCNLGSSTRRTSRLVKHDLGKKPETSVFRALCVKRASN